MITKNAIKTPDGTIIESKYRHHFVCHKDKNGNIYCVDGGLDYLKRIGPPDYTELSTDSEIIKDIDLKEG